MQFAPHKNRKHEDPPRTNLLHTRAHLSRPHHPRQRAHIPLPRAQRLLQLRLARRQPGHIQREHPGVLVRAVLTVWIRDQSPPPRGALGELRAQLAQRCVACRQQRESARETVVEVVELEGGACWRLLDVAAVCWGFFWRHVCAAVRCMSCLVLFVGRRKHQAVGFLFYIAPHPPDRLEKKKSARVSSPRAARNQGLLNLYVCTC